MIIKYCDRCKKEIGKSVDYNWSKKKDTLKLLCDFSLTEWHGKFKYTIENGQTLNRGVFWLCQSCSEEFITFLKAKEGENG